MAGTIDSFSYGKKCSFLCKTFSLFLPCNMAAGQNLYIEAEIRDILRIFQSRMNPKLVILKRSVF